MKVEFIQYDDLTENQQAIQPNNGYGKENADYLRVSHNGGDIYLKSDAMEPEDCFFYKDLKWIKEVIEKAYELGCSEMTIGELK